MGENSSPERSSPQSILPKKLTKSKLCLNGVTMEYVVLPNKTIIDNSKNFEGATEETVNQGSALQTQNKHTFSFENTIKDCHVEIQRDELIALMKERTQELREFKEKLTFKSQDENLSSPSVRLRQLEEQMRMHVQLLTQTCLLTHGNSKFDSLNKTSKSYLFELKLFASLKLPGDKSSAFAVHNLDEALEIINLYERITDKEMEMLKFGSDVPLHVRNTLATSKVFIYPELLPICGFCNDIDGLIVERNAFSAAEENLITMGLEQFDELEKYEKIEYIQTFMVPAKTVIQIKNHIEYVLSRKNPMANPIKYFDEFKEIPDFKRVIRLFDPNNVKAPEEYSPDLLPKWMSSLCKKKLPATKQRQQRFTPRRRLDKTKSMNKVKTKSIAPRPTRQTYISPINFQPILPCMSDSLSLNETQIVLCVGNQLATLLPLKNTQTERTNAAVSVNDASNQPTETIQPPVSEEAELRTTSSTDSGDYMNFDIFYNNLGDLTKAERASKKCPPTDVIEHEETSLLSSTSKKATKRSDTVACVSEQRINSCQSYEVVENATFPAQTITASRRLPSNFSVVRDIINTAEKRRDVSHRKNKRKNIPCKKNVLDSSKKAKMDNDPTSKTQQNFCPSYKVVEIATLPTQLNAADKELPSNSSVAAEQKKSILHRKNRRKSVPRKKNELDLLKETDSHSAKWEGHEDKLIITNCQKYGLTQKAFAASVKTLTSRNAEEVEARFLHLLKLLAVKLNSSSSFKMNKT